MSESSERGEKQFLQEVALWQLGARAFVAG